MPYPAELALFIVVAVLSGLLLLFLFLYRPVRRYFFTHHTVRAYYRRIVKIAEDHDFYLINNFKSKTSDSEVFHIDHLLVGNKFIYCIRDRYYEGALTAKEEDPTWILYLKKGSKYIPNPMTRNQVRTERLSLITGIESDIFISIVLINDDCLTTPFESNSEDSFLVSMKALPALIEELESRDVPPLDSWEVERVVADFATLKDKADED